MPTPSKLERQVDEIARTMNGRDGLVARMTGAETSIQAQKEAFDLFRQDADKRHDALMLRLDQIAPPTPVAEDSSESSETKPTVPATVVSLVPSTWTPMAVAQAAIVFLVATGLIGAVAGVTSASTTGAAATEAIEQTLEKAVDDGKAVPLAAPRLQVMPVPIPVPVLPVEPADPVEPPRADDLLPLEVP